MSAPTPASGGGIPSPGYYPDPSIPGYIRYWNGTAWVPGTSRAAPADGEAPPPPPAGTPAPAPSFPQQPSSGPAVDETGPVFLDEDDPEPEAAPEPEDRVPPGQGPEPEPEDRAPGVASAADVAGAWHAVDVSRQDQRVSWGSTEPPALTVPAELGGPSPQGRGADAGAQSGERAEPQRPERSEPSRAPAAPMPAQPDPSPAADPRAGAGVWGRPAHEPTRADSAAQAAASAPAPVRPQPEPQRFGPPQPQPPLPPQPQPQPQPSLRPQPQPQVHPQPGPEPRIPAAPERQIPSAAREEQPVVPWRPPAPDPFGASVRSTARPAGFGRRFFARLIDGVLVSAIIGAAAVPLVTRSTEHIQDKIDAAEKSGKTVTVWLVDGTTGPYLGMLLGLFLLLGFLYEALPTAKWGRTLGKKLCGVRVLDIESQSPPSTGGAFKRWLTYGVLGLIGIGVLNVMWCLFDRPWRQCWHDKAARTYVARS